MIDCKYQGHEKVLTAESDDGSDGSAQGLLDDDHVQRAAHVDEGDGDEEDDDADKDAIDGSLGANDGDAARRRLGQQLFVLAFVGDAAPQVDGHVSVAQEDARHVELSRVVAVGQEFRGADQKLGRRWIDGGYVRVAVGDLHFEERGIVVEVAAVHQCHFHLLHLTFYHLPSTVEVINRGILHIFVYLCIFAFFFY